MFNAKGYLEPGFHDWNATQIEDNLVKAFPNSKTRPNIFSGYQKLMIELSKVGLPHEQWLNGSFSSSKEDPNDVDMVSFLDYDEVNKLTPDKQQILLEIFAGPNTKSKYLCDSYYVPIVDKSHPNYAQLHQVRMYWYGEFGLDRDENPKGIVRFPPKGTP